MVSADISNIENQELLDFANQRIKDFKNFEFFITFKSDYSQSRLIRNFVGFLFEKNNVDPQWKNRFSLIADELVNNSIEYGSLPLDKNLFAIKFVEAEDNLIIRLEVHDTGKGMFAKNAAQMEEIRKEKQQEGFEKYLDKRGRGLFQLVTNMVDKLYFFDKPGGGLIVGVQKSLPIKNPQAV